MGNIERNIFEVHFETGCEAQLRDTKVTWVAYPSHIPNIFSGTATTRNRRKSSQPQSLNRDYVSFGKVFGKEPGVFMGVNELDFRKSLGLRLHVRASNITPYGFTWDADSWGESVCYSAGVSWLAMGD